MTTNSLHKSVMFVDVVGSVDLFRAIGDAAATQEIQSTLANWQRTIANYRGHVVKSLGDGLLCVFDDVDDICLALADINNARMDARLSSHAGMHVGEVVMHDNDIFGQSVNLASRLADFAAPGEFLASQSAVDQMSDVHRAQTRFFKSVGLKGLATPVPTYQYLCGEDNTTFVANVKARTAIAVNALHLDIAGTQVQIPAGTGRYTIGRDAANDMVVNADMVSRMHATIRFENGHFTISDHSTNGTLLQPEGGSLRDISRTTAPLSGRGDLYFGKFGDQYEPVRAVFEIR